MVSFMVTISIIMVKTIWIMVILGIQIIIIATVSVAVKNSQISQLIDQEKMMSSYKSDKPPRPKLDFFETEFGTFVIRVIIGENRYTYISEDFPWVRSILKKKFFSMKDFNRIKNNTRLVSKCEII